MIGVLTHHWAKPDQVAAARKLLEGNGVAQSKHRGFGARQTMYSASDPTKITTLVTWQSNEIYDAWRASPERTRAMSGADKLWAKPPESERFDMVEAVNPRVEAVPGMRPGQGPPGRANPRVG